MRYFSANFGKQKLCGPIILFFSMCYVALFTYAQRTIHPYTHTHCNIQKVLKYWNSSIFVYKGPFKYNVIDQGGGDVAK